MRFLAVLIVIIILVAFIKLKSKKTTPSFAVQPNKMEIDISIKDSGQDGMPVITIRSNAGTLNIESVKQDTGRYVVSADKQADNVVVVSIDKKTND